jgi:hypothetical protein
MSRLLVSAYLIEAGLLLLVVPWSVFWERNAFIDRVPLMSGTLTNLYVRGAVSGIGLVCLWAATAEVALFIAERRYRNREPYQDGADGAGVQHDAR